MECAGCGGLLTGRQKRWCSAACQKRAGRERWLLTIYNLDFEAWERIFIFQGGVCGICGREPRAGETFHVDHEHTAGQAGVVRGILCAYCNTRLVGRLKSHERARALADYLENPPAVQALGEAVIAPGRPKKKRAPRRKRR